MGKSKGTGPDNADGEGKDADDVAEEVAFEVEDVVVYDQRQGLVTTTFWLEPRAGQGGKMVGKTKTPLFAGVARIDVTLGENEQGQKVEWCFDLRDEATHLYVHVDTQTGEINQQIEQRCYRTESEEQRDMLEVIKWAEEEGD